MRNKIIRSAATSLLGCCFFGYLRKEVLRVLLYNLLTFWCDFVLLITALIIRFSILISFILIISFKLHQNLKKIEL